MQEHRTAIQTPAALAHVGAAHWTGHVLFDACHGGPQGELVEDLAVASDLVVDLAVASDLVVDLAVASDLVVDLAVASDLVVDLAVAGELLEDLAADSGCGPDRPSQARSQPWSPPPRSATSSRPGSRSSSCRAAQLRMALALITHGSPEGIRSNTAAAYRSASSRARALRYARPVKQREGSLG